MHDYTIPIGPQSPMLKEPMCLRVSLEGNYIQEARIRLGYIHRGIEKLLEGRKVGQCVYIAEHICGLCSHQHSMCFVNAIEKILGFKAERKVRFIRALIAELERAHSHLLWFGFAMHEIGYETLFNYAMREREFVLECFERLTGNRVHHGINKVNGVRYDFGEKDKEFVLGRMKKIERKLPFYLKTVERNRVINARLKDVGIIPKKTVRGLGLVGPVARGSGVPMDTRKDSPYGAYPDVDFDVVTGDGCDALARAIVRLKEVGQALGIIGQLARNMPSSRIPKVSPPSIKSGMDYGRVEAPRGENFHLYKVKDDAIVRGRIRTPTFVNIQVLTEILKGVEIGDVPVIVSSLDPCFGCLERVIVVKDGRREVLGENGFRSKYC